MKSKNTVTQSSKNKMSKAIRKSAKKITLSQNAGQALIKPETFALATAVIVGGTGLLGMISALRRPTNDRTEEMKSFNGYGKIMGIVPTKNLLNWVRVGIGIAGLVASRDSKRAVVFNRAIASNYAGMALMGAWPKTDTLFGVMPIFGANVALHGGIALAELFTEPKVIEPAKASAPVIGRLVSKAVLPKARSLTRVKSKVLPKVMRARKASHSRSSASIQ